MENSPVHRQIRVLGNKVVDESPGNGYPLIHGVRRSDWEVATDDEFAQASVRVLDSKNRKAGSGVRAWRDRVGDRRARQGAGRHVPTNEVHNPVVAASCQRTGYRERFPGSSTGYIIPVFPIGVEGPGTGKPYPGVVDGISKRLPPG